MRGGERRDERRDGERRGEEERRREAEKGGSQHDNDSPPPSLDVHVCSSITYTVWLISVAMRTLADSIWPDPQPEGDVFLVLNNRKKPWRECVTMATYHYYKTAISHQIEVYLSPYMYLTVW